MSNRLHNNANEFFSKIIMSHLTGLYTPYSVNRPLTQQEKIDQLHQGKPHCESKFIRDGDTVIKMNSTYLETVDRYYADKGNASLVTFVIFMAISGLLLYGYLILFERYIFSEEDFAKRYDVMILTAIFSPALYFCLKLTLKEWFKKTHYPIRFNRKNKMIYVYQVSGNILSISWNKVFFIYAKGKGAFP
ncbi:hypothetical protein J8V57_16315 [Xenorhabdus sp. PB61.4]|uniref:DUF6708 domain-containing protein n=1 Tax=Xenorhabdus sp. PB61.4 TaxID=2788940 RepID=UPI001E48F289|nr:DUF6708 domain-containing protein [Xenorhabdus sp. PB61.4]MCC8367815.1 hypothetical protein [Xenorhabdus sp. PB61.4]